MSKSYAVWIDHKEARVFHVGEGLVDKSTVLAPLHHIHHKHPKGPEGARRHPDDAKRFFRAVVDTMQERDDVLIVGPSTAKLDFVRFVHEHDAPLESRIVGVETVDHPTDGQIVAFATRYFEASAA